MKLNKKKRRFFFLNINLFCHNELVFVQSMNNLEAYFIIYLNR